MYDKNFRYLFQQLIWHLTFHHVINVYTSAFNIIFSIRSGFYNFIQYLNLSLFWDLNLRYRKLVIDKLILLLENRWRKC